MSALTTTAAARRTSTRPDPRRADAPARPRLRVVPRQRRTARYVVAMVVLGAAGIFGIVSLSALAAESAFAARALEAEIDELSLRYDELTAEVAGLESPERVRAVATTELGMVRADQPAFLVVERPVGSATQPAAEPEIEPAASRRVADPVKQALGAGG